MTTNAAQTTIVTLSFTETLGRALLALPVPVGRGHLGDHVRHLWYEKRRLNVQVSPERFEVVGRFLAACMENLNKAERRQVTEAMETLIVAASRGLTPQSLN